MADLDLWINKSFLSNYADDTQTCAIADSPEELRKIVEEESKAVLSFFSGINLCNNSDKAALLINSKGFAGKMSIEIGENQFSCTACDKTFSNQEGLQEHEKTHSDEKTFNCKHCDKTFSEFFEIKEHERTHTMYCHIKRRRETIGIKNKF